MPANLVKTVRDERLWQAAKKIATQQGRAKDWAYIVGIFQRLKSRSGGQKPKG